MTDSDRQENQLLGTNAVENVLGNDPHFKTATTCLVIIAVVLVTFSIYWLRPVLVPLVIALFVVSGISPLLRSLESGLGVNRFIAAGITFVTGIIVMFVVGMTIWLSVVDLEENKDDYTKRVKVIVNNVEAKAELALSKMLPKLGVPDGVMKTRDPLPLSEASEFVELLLRNSISYLSQGLLGLVSTGIVVLIYVFFLLIGTPHGRQVNSLVGEIDLQVRSYLSLKTVISIFTGAAFGLTLYLFGVPMAFTFGVLAFLLNFVPNVGPLVASLLPIPLIVLAADQSVWWMIGAIGASCTVQAISGNLIEPKLMGDKSDLHPVTVLVALMFWGMMWGIVGMFLATPITAALRILFGRIEITRPLAALMAGRWGQPASES